MLQAYAALLALMAAQASRLKPGHATSSTIEYAVSENGPPLLAKQLATLGALAVCSAAALQDEGEVQNAAGSVATGRYSRPPHTCSVAVALPPVPYALVTVKRDALQPAAEAGDDGDGDGEGDGDAPAAQIPAHGLAAAYAGAPAAAASATPLAELSARKAPALAEESRKTVCPGNTAAMLPPAAACVRGSGAGGGVKGAV